MPLAKNARGVTRLPEHLRQRGGVQRQALPLEDCMRHAILELVPPGEERAARGRAGRADVKLVEAHALGAEAIQVGRLQDRVPVGGNVAVALIVSEKEHDVGLATGECGVGPGNEARKNQQSGEEAEGGHHVGKEGDSAAPRPVPTWRRG
jgi:hypothetical protein